MRRKLRKIAFFLPPAWQVRERGGGGGPVKPVGGASLTCYLASALSLFSLDVRLSLRRLVFVCLLCLCVCCALIVADCRLVAVPAICIVKVAAARHTGGMKARN